MNHRVAILAAGVLGTTGVAAGAFGAHALRGVLVERGMLEVWQTAVHYHLLHAVALLGLACWRRGETAAAGRKWCGRAGWLWFFGTVLFSGSLYLLAVGAPHWVGPITPIGGAALIIGWIALIGAAVNSAEAR